MASRFRACAAAASVALAASLAAPPAGAVDWGKLVMPGPVIAGHAKVEGQCSKCHAPFERTDENRLCLDCHEPVAADLSAKTGFHGRHAPVAGAPCRSCHTEHAGRDADIVGLDAEAFPHGETDFPLRDAHARVACAACHPAGKPHREAGGDCIGCHRQDDAHGGKLGERCADCHGEASWKRAEFDHAKTDFALTGRHAQVECALCHPAGRYEGVPKDCNGCHRLDDHHRGKFGPRCESCHDTRGWKHRGFDHAAETGFALSGRHARIDCRACHEGGDLHADLPRDCRGCHELDDDHRGRFGPRCADCHGEVAWSPARFDHARRTDWPLEGAHAAVSCERCHTGPLFDQALPTACDGCHRKDDPHRGQEGNRCERCHDARAWAGRVAFDHDLTRFPLLGLHASVACEECHLSQAFQDADHRCAACHQRDDAHERRLGTECAACHNPNGWRWWRFDHDRQTEFALHGSHEGLECRACHRAPQGAQVEQSRSCHACHAADDAHSGRLGRRCEICHVDASWQEVKR